MLSFTVGLSEHEKNCETSYRVVWLWCDVNEKKKQNRLHESGKKINLYFSVVFYFPMQKHIKWSPAEEWFFKFSFQGKCNQTMTKLEEGEEEEANLNICSDFSFLFVSDFEKNTIYFRSLKLRIFFYLNFYRLSYSSIVFHFLYATVMHFIILEKKEEKTGYSVLWFEWKIT